MSQVSLAPRPKSPPVPGRRAPHDRQTAAVRAVGHLSRGTELATDAREAAGAAGQGAPVFNNTGTVRGMIRRDPM